MQPDLWKCRFHQWNPMYENTVIWEAYFCQGCKKWEKICFPRGYRSLRHHRVVVRGVPPRYGPPQLSTFTIQNYARRSRTVHDIAEGGQLTWSNNNVLLFNPHNSLLSECFSVFHTYPEENLWTVLKYQADLWNQWVSSGHNKGRCVIVDPSFVAFALSADPGFWECSRVEPSSEKTLCERLRKWFRKLLRGRT